MKAGIINRDLFSTSGTAANMNDGIKLLNENDENLQEHFRKIWDEKAKNIRNWVLTKSTFREYLLDRYWANVTERIIFIMQLPKQVRFEKYIDWCNFLIRLSHYDKLKMWFGFYDHDFDNRISVSDGLLMMRYDIIILLYFYKIPCFYNWYKCKIAK